MAETIKPRVLYCDLEFNTPVHNALSDSFRLDTFYDFRNNPIDVIKEAIDKNDRYEGMVTHLPWNYDYLKRAVYSKTARNLIEIKLLDLDLRIVGYTGMGPNTPAKLMIYDSGVEFIADRTRDLDKDGKMVTSMMKTLLQEKPVDYCNNPKIYDDGSNIFADTEVNCMSGICLSEVCSLVKLIRGSTKEMTIENRLTKQESSCKDIVGVLSLELSRSTPIRFIINDVSDDAKNIALKACDVVSLKYPFLADYSNKNVSDSTLKLN